MRMIVERGLLFCGLWIISVTGSALHGPCESDDDCGIIDTVCQKGACACREDFAVWFDSCVPLAQPRLSCTKKHECHKVLGVKSMCTKKNQCVCKPFHHLHKGQCVKNRDLHDTCDHDFQCYCGADCQEKIACIHKNCSCKAGHSPYKSRRCFSDNPVVLMTLADQQAQTAPLEEEPLSESKIEEKESIHIKEETQPKLSSSGQKFTTSIFLTVSFTFTVISTNLLI